MKNLIEKIEKDLLEEYRKWVLQGNPKFISRLCKKYNLDLVNSHCNSDECSLEIWIEDDSRFNEINDYYHTYVISVVI